MSEVTAMGAIVTSFMEFRNRYRRGERRPGPITDAEWVQQHIRRELRFQCEPTRIDQAIARAERRIAQGCDPADAIRFVIAWARDADPDRNPPPPAAA